MQLLVHLVYNQPFIHPNRLESDSQISVKRTNTTEMRRQTREREEGVERGRERDIGDREGEGERVNKMSITRRGEIPRGKDKEEWCSLLFRF